MHIRRLLFCLLILLSACGSQAVAHAPEKVMAPNSPPTVNVAELGERSCTYKEVGTDYGGTRQVKVICETLSHVTIYYIDTASGAVVRVVIPVPAP